VDTVNVDEGSVVARPVTGRAFPSHRQRTIPFVMLPIRDEVL